MMIDLIEPHISLNSGKGHKATSPNHGFDTATLYGYARMLCASLIQ